MRRMRLALAIAALALLSARPASAQEMEIAEGEEVEFTAQVVDMSCAIVFNLSGEDHEICSLVCAENGIPLGLLSEDGVFYLPVSKGMPGTGANEMLKEHAEQKVKVRGTVIQRGGVNTIIIESLETA